MTRLHRSTAGLRKSSPALRLRSRVAIGLLSLLPLTASATGADQLEYQVKAAFLLNFTRFVEWPPESAGASAASICISGADPFGGVIDQMVAGETLQGRRLEVLRVHRPFPASCRVLFINGPEKNVSGLLEPPEPGVLTVSEEAGFLREGGIIQFVVEKHRVRFDINQSAAAKAGLKISSKLLSIARSVEK
ncbi:MAG: YfiR family protein [Acidobacteriota bacterium]|nr:YfiR family protein [Acidobacteriota bacterium]